MRYQFRVFGIGNFCENGGAQNTCGIGGMHDAGSAKADIGRKINCGVDVRLGRGRNPASLAVDTARTG